MAEICDRQGLVADAADLWRRFLRVATADLDSADRLRPPFRRYQEAWVGYFHRAFGQMGLKGDGRDAALYLKRRMAEASAFPETLPAIEALRPHYRLALLSNADDDFLLACLERNRLHFDPIVSSEEAGAIKPHPAIFERLTREMGLKPEQILYVGDNPWPDVLGGRQAGLRVAWVNRYRLRRPRQVPPPDIKVTSLAELVPFLAPDGADAVGANAKTA